MSVFWATQYRPADLPGAVDAFGEVSEMFAGVGATRTRLLVAITQDVGTMIVVTTWSTLAEAIAAFDPVDGSASRAVAASPTLSDQLTASGPPLRRLTGLIDHEFGDTGAGRYVVNVVQSTSAGSELWDEAAHSAWDLLGGEGVLGLQTAQVLTGDATGLRVSSVMTDDVSHFVAALSEMPDKLAELFAATGTTTQVRNVHRVVSA